MREPRSAECKLNGEPVTLYCQKPAYTNEVTWIYNNSTVSQVYYIPNGLEIFGGRVNLLRIACIPARHHSVINCIATWSDGAVVSNYATIKVLGKNWAITVLIFLLYHDPV